MNTTTSTVCRPVPVHIHVSENQVTGLLITVGIFVFLHALLRGIFS